MVTRVVNTIISELENKVREDPDALALCRVLRELIGVSRDAQPLGLSDETARNRGRPIPPPSADELKFLRGQGLTLRELAARYNVHTSTVYRWLRRYGYFSSQEANAAATPQHPSPAPQNIIEALLGSDD